MYITKSSGEIVPFDPAKLRRSLERVGADNNTIDLVLARIEPELQEGLTTRRLYRTAFALLKKIDTPHLAGKYKIKNAIMELGPSGYSFEKFIGRLLAFHGYDCRVGTSMQGKCVSHEVDVVAQKENEVLIAECKFHNSQGRKSDIKIPLYVYARFLDIESQKENNPELSGKDMQCWIFTNTRFSEDAIVYGKCMGLRLIGWDYPLHGNLRERIHLAGTYPVTSLTSLTKKEKTALLEKEVVLCSDLAERAMVLSETGIRQNRIKNIILEAEELCKT